LIYEDVFKAFDEKGVRYLVVGGMAVNLYDYKTYRYFFKEPN
jgi:hypothetical protein